MKMISKVIASISAFVVFMLPAVAQSGTLATQTARIERGGTFLMCGAITTATGACDDNTRATAATDIYARVGKFESVTFSLTEEDDAGTSVCEIYAAGSEVDVNGTADLSSLTPYVKVNTFSLTPTVPKLTLRNFDFSYMWVDCSAVDSTSTTVYMQGSRALGVR